jgi:hypothetical protein
VDFGGANGRLTSCPYGPGKTLYFSVLKRGVYGSFHHVSKHHLQRYCDEFSFRWNRRQATNAARTEDALRMSEGQRLSYRAPARKVG